MKRDLSVDVPGGRLRAMDFGGRGPDILLLHPAGMASVIWQPLGWELSDRAHAVAIDLPGHGQSTAPFTDQEAVAEMVLTAIDQLGLSSPIVVGQDIGAFVGMLASIRRPEAIRGIISIDSSFAVTREEVEINAFVRTPEFADDLRRRMGFGQFFESEAQCYAFIDGIAEQSSSDSILRDLSSSDIAESLLAGVRREEDGWRIHPLPEIVGVAFYPGEEAAHQQCEEIYDELTVPVLVVHPTQGYESHTANRLAMLERTHDVLSVEWLHGDRYIALSEPQRIAALIHRFAQQHASRAIAS